ncbi:hypothetical protein [Eubacterium aggregans]|uniref:hypothetical protein n=1 Tax=Eubacterium aggregans TaxID=81409 RepID=UPI003F3BD915
MNNVLLICRQKEVGRVLTEILREMAFEQIDVMKSGLKVGGGCRKQNIPSPSSIHPLGMNLALSLHRIF